MTISGLGQFEARLLAAPERALTAMAAALYAEGQDLLAATLPVTPIDLGPLRASGAVSPPDVEGLGIVVEVGFGGPAVDYAIFVHEDLEARHNPPTKAKFLEDTALELAPSMGARMAASLATTLRL